MNDIPRPEYVSIEVILFINDYEQLRSILESDGFMVTVASKMDELFDLVSKKFYIAIVADLNHPDRAAGFRVMSGVKRLSPLSHLYMVGSDVDPEEVAASYRIGIRDFYLMRDNWAQALAKRIVEDAREVTHKDLMEKTLLELWELQVQSVNRLFDLHKKLVQADMNRQYRGGEIPEEELPPARVLVVASDGDVVTALKELMPQEKGWILEILPTGGEGLDVGSSREFDGYVVQENLPDLMGTMVLSSIRPSARNPGVLVKTSDTGIRATNMAGEEISLQDFRRILLSIRKKRWEEHMDKMFDDTFRSSHLDLLGKFKNIMSRMGKLGLLGRGQHANG